MCDITSFCARKTIRVKSNVDSGRLSFTYLLSQFHLTLHTWTHINLYLDLTTTRNMLVKHYAPPPSHLHPTPYLTKCLSIRNAVVEKGNNSDNSTTECLKSAIMLPAGTWRWNNVHSTLIQRQDVESTLNRRCFNAVCPLGLSLKRSVIWANIYKFHQRFTRSSIQRFLDCFH